jgi:taurine dioxygenase
MSATAAEQLVFTNLGGHMAVAVDGADLSRPPDAALASRLRNALLDHQVLCIRGQSIGPGEFLAAIAAFGTPQVRPEIPHVPGFPAVTTLSSEDRDTKGDGKRLVAGATWHSDDTFMAEPSALTALYGIVVPPVGGDTQYANMYAAYEALPADMRQRLDGL